MPDISKEKPTVSVVIPAYNRAHSIGRAIQSVLNQTYQDLEIIVVDDGSSDNTSEVVRSLKDERIRYIRHEDNKGASAARNTAIKAVKGEYIAFQDSDDEWLPQKLEKQMRVFENAPPEVSIVYTDMWKVYGDGRIEYWHSPTIILTRENIINPKTLDYQVKDIGLGSTLIKRECFDKVGLFDKKFPRLIDLEFFIRLSKYYSFSHLREPLLKYYATEGISSNAKALVTARILLLEKYFEDIRRDKKFLVKEYFDIGVDLCLNNEIAEGEGYIAKAFEINPDRQLLSEKYFIIGRRLYSNNNVKNGRSYLIKAIKTYPFNIRLLSVALISFFGQGVYRKGVEFYRKINEIWVK